MQVTLSNVLLHEREENVPRDVKVAYTQSADNGAKNNDTINK